MVAHWRVPIEVIRAGSAMRLFQASQAAVTIASYPSKTRLESLVVHPLSCCGIWHDSDPGAARGAVAPSAAPEEGVLVLVPVRGGAPDGLFNLGPGLEAAALEGQRAQDLPPRLDQV